MLKSLNKNYKVKGEKIDGLNEEKFLSDFIRLIKSKDFNLYYKMNFCVHVLSL